MTIIFDLGGVLVHLDWDKVCALFVERSDRAPEFVRGEVTNGPIVTRSMRGLIGPREFHEALCDKLGIDVSYESFAGIWTRLLSPNETIVPLVDRLKANHRLVLASNTDEIHFTYAVQHFAALRQFDRCFLSYEMGILKPDPAFFRHMLRSLDAPPADCVFIDDRPENVDSARWVGISALQFEGAGKLHSDLAAMLRPQGGSTGSYQS